MKKKRAVIIGGGLAGLSCAIRLQSQGVQTTILEKNNHAGGKLHEVKLGNYSFDFGPNTITMPDVFKSVLLDAGKEPDKYFTFRKLDTHTKNVFHDGSEMFFSSDKERMTHELSLLDSESAKNYEAYLNEVQKLYLMAEKHFFNRTFTSWKDYLSIPLARAMMSVRPLESMDRFHRRFFKDKRIVTAFNRYATYVGSSPYSAPATFGLIGHLELGDGVYYVNGGNFRIADGFALAAAELGCEIRTGTEAEKAFVKNGKITGILASDGHEYTGDTFVLNGDLLTQYPRLIDEKDRPSMKDKEISKTAPSVSAFVILAALKEKFNVHHHQIFFGSKPSQEFSDIFHRGNYSNDPSIYICTSRKTDPARAPEGDNMFILVNAPPLPDEDQTGHKNETEKIEQLIYAKLSEKGLPIKQSLKASSVKSPRHIASGFYAFRGALYGLASNSKKNSFLRPFNRPKDIGNLYFTGGSTHPGGGSPMVVLSGRNTADLIMSGILSDD